MTYTVHYYELKPNKSGWIQTSRTFTDFIEASQCYRLHRNAVMVDDQGRIVKGTRANLPA